jgi:threonine/homoserine/homoserine lactone efflux protein
MFHYTLIHWTTFLTAIFLLNISPGPDMAFILGQTARSGRHGGFAAVFGIWSGTFLHVLMAAAGLSIILATSALAFSVVKWAGAAYLIWIGIQALRSHGGSILMKDSDAPARSWRGIYWQGIFVSALNPKVATFFLAFLPQFVVDGAGPVSAQLFLHGTLIIIAAAFVEPPLVLAGARITMLLRNNERIALWMDRSLGALFIALGIRLAVSE